MTYIAQLAGMVLSGFVLVLIVHWVIIYIHEPRGHYLVRVLNFLEGIFPEELIIIGFACAFIVSFAMMFVAALLSDNGNFAYIRHFAIGCGVYCMVPLYKTWFPYMIGRMFPGRRL